MEDIIRPIYQEYESQENTLGILLIEKDISVLLSDTFDINILIVVKEAEQPIYITHYANQGKKIALHIIMESQIIEWLRSGTNRKLSEWFVVGEVLFDRNECIEQIKNKLKEFPMDDRKFKMSVEFSKLIHCYMDGKAFFENQQYLDAYSHIVRSLHHLGRLSLINKGYHPEMTVWNQVRQIEPEVYKLYNELINSEEELGKRLQLLFLASDFLIHSRIEAGMSYLLDVLKGKDVWSFNEVLSHPSLRSFVADIEVLFEYLIEKHFIEVLDIEIKGQGIYHRKYRLSEKLLCKKV